MIIAEPRTLEPPPDRASNGSFATGAIRARTGWFGFAIIEEQIQDCFGTRFWRRIELPTLIRSPKWSE